MWTSFNRRWHSCDPMCHWLCMTLNEPARMKREIGIELYQTKGWSLELFEFYPWNHDIAQEQNSYLQILLIDLSSWCNDRPCGCHNAILFSDNSDNFWYNQVDWLVLSIIASNRTGCIQFWLITNRIYLTVFYDYVKAGLCFKNIVYSDDIRVEVLFLHLLQFQLHFMFVILMTFIEV